jgi:SNF2 family DNA or RNA helicase
LRDPLQFLELLHPHNLDSSLNSTQQFFGTTTTTTTTGTPPSSIKQTKTPQHAAAGGQTTILQQAAFGLLQWAQNGETFDFSSNEEKERYEDDTVTPLVVDDKEEEDYTVEVADDEAAIENDGLVTPQAILQEMDAPPDFKATLRPYQRQALWWMTQREAQNELEDSTKQQLELLEELVQKSTGGASSRSVSSLSTNHMSSSSPIHCECGPVQVDTSQIPAPAVGDPESNPDMKHPLWERRFLTNPSKSKALSFYVQPLFGAAMACPPEPPRACRGGILADSMGLVRCSPSWCAGGGYHSVHRERILGPTFSVC